MAHPTNKAFSEELYNPATTLFVMKPHYQNKLCIVLSVYDG